MNEIVINQLREIADQAKEDDGRKSVLLEAARLLENYDKNKESVFAIKINTNAAVWYALTEAGLKGYAERFSFSQQGYQTGPAPTQRGHHKRPTLVVYGNVRAHVLAEPESSTDGSQCFIFSDSTDGRFD